MLIQKQSTSHEAAIVLQGAGFALIVAYAITVLSAAYPLVIMQPGWMLRVCNSLRETAALPLLGASLLVIAQQCDSDMQPLARRMVFIRRVALWASVGFLLLIPLQIYAGMQLNQGRADLENRQRREIERAGFAIQRASDEASLRQALALLPGSPPLPNGSLDVPLAQIKKNLMEQITPLSRRLEVAIADARRQRLERSLQGWLRDALVAGAYGLAFAVLGQSGPGQTSFLAHLGRGWRRPLVGWGRRRQGREQRRGLMGRP
jgi:hypothetical protein